jgi:hypothetical protein
VAQRQAAVAAQVDVPDLDVGLARAQVVLARQQLAQLAVAVLVVDGADQQLALAGVVVDGEQAQSRISCGLRYWPTKLSSL